MRLSVVSFFFSGLLLQLQGSVFAYLVEPSLIDASLPSKALVLIPGAFVPDVAYRSLAEELIASSKSYGFNLFVSVVKPLTALPDPVTIPRMISDVVTELRKKADIIPEKDLFLGGHSLGGVVASTYKGKYAGLLLFASYLTDEPSKWDKPALIIVGERDGNLKLSSSATIYRKVARHLENNPNDEYKFPVVVLPHVTHSQFTSIERLSNPIAPPDLPAIIPLKAAQQMIAKASVIFMSIHFRISAQHRLFTEFDSFLSGTNRVIGGYIEALDTPLESICKATQSMIGGPRSDSMRKDVTIHSNLYRFLESKPSFTDTSIQIQAISFRPLVKGPRLNPLEQNDVIGCKGISSDALGEAFGDVQRWPGSCKDALIELSNYARSLLNADQKKRFDALGRNFVVGDSVSCKTGLCFSTNDPNVSNDNRGNSVVNAIELKVPLDSPFMPGKHYCKLPHPARLLEYLIVDAYLD